MGCGDSKFEEAPVGASPRSPPTTKVPPPAKGSKVSGSLLSSAAQRGSVAELADFLARVAPELQGTKEYQLLLHTACQYLQPDCVRLLLDKGFPVDAKDGAQRTPLHTTIQVAAKLEPGSMQEQQALKIVKLIIERCRKQGPGGIRSIDVYDANATPLLLAMATKQDAIAQELFDADFDLSNATIPERNNVFHLSVGNVRQLMSVLQAATDKGSKAVLASQPNADGNTPLHMAILVMGQMVLAPEPGDDDRVGGTPGMPSCMLIEDGCFIDIPNAKGQTAVSLAVECAARAMAAGRDVSACTEVLLTLSKGSTSASGNAALALFDQPSHPSGVAMVHVAAQLGNIELLDSLKSRGANMDLPDAQGRLPAVIVAKEGHNECLMHLLGRLHADALRVDRSGDSAAIAVLRNPSHYHLEDTLQIFRTMVAGWGQAQFSQALPLLCHACSMGLKEVVHLLVLEGGVDPNPIGMQALLPLGATVQAHCRTPSAQLVMIAEFLVQNGAHPVAEDNSRQTPLGQALNTGNLDMAMVMLRVYPEHVDYVSSDGSTALLLAIKQGATALAEELLALKASSGPMQGVRGIPIHAAVEARNAKLVNMLLNTEQGCQAVAVKDPSNKSVLDYLWAGWQAALPRVRIPGTVAAATANGHAVAIATANGGRAPDAGTMLEISRLILTHTMCDVNSLDLQGMRPLHWAVALEQPALVKILAQREKDEVNPNLTDRDGVTPLFRAVQKGNQDLVETMLAELPTLDFTATSRIPGAPHGWTALQAAIDAANVSLVKLLMVQRNVRFDRRSFDICMRLVAKRPQACVDIMTELSGHRSSDIAQWLTPSMVTQGAANAARQRSALLTPGSQMDASIVSGSMEEPIIHHPLHYAVQHNNAALVNLLCVKGASVDQKDFRGVTPLHYAVEMRAYEAAAKLVAFDANVIEPSGGTTPLIAAVAKMDTQMVKELLKTKNAFDINKEDSRGFSAFSTVIHRMLLATRKPGAQAQLELDSGTDIALLLIKAKADVNEPTILGSQWAQPADVDMSDGGYSTTGSLPSPTGGHSTPSYHAHPSLLNQLEDSPMTPLVAAICVSNKRVVDILMRVDSADVNAVHCPFPAVHVALRALQSLGASGAAAAAAPDEPHNAEGWRNLFGAVKRAPAGPPTSGAIAAAPTAASDAARQDAISIMRSVANDDRTNLLSTAPWNGKDSKGPTVLMQLAGLGGMEATQLVRDLLIRGRELAINAADGGSAETALHLAATKGECAMLEVLMRAKTVNLNPLDARGRTPLAAAVAANNRQAVTTILANGLNNVHAMAPLDPCACGSDPSSSPLALAVALPTPDCLEALIQGVSEQITGNSSHHSDIDQSVRGLSQARGDAQDYDPSALLNSRVDTQGRPAVLAAMIALKLQHVRLLVRAGARLDIKGEMSYGGQGNAVLRSPYSFLCEYIRSLKDKARLEEARGLALLMSECDTLDLSDGSELSWAVLTKRDDVVAPLAERAQAAGVINTRSDMYKGQALNALELAVKLDCVSVAKVLISRGATITPALMNEARASAKMHALLTKPPPVIPPRTKLPHGVRPLDLESISVQPSMMHTSENTVVELPDQFRTALAQALSAASTNQEGCPPGPMEELLDTIIRLVNALMETEPREVQLHANVFRVMQDVLEKHKPVLNELQDECLERSRYYGRGTCIPREVLERVKALGDVYAAMYKKIEEWRTTEKKVLINHLIASGPKELKNVRGMGLALFSRMAELALALDTYQALPNRQQPLGPMFAYDRNKTSAQLKGAMAADLQEPEDILGLYAAVLLSGDTAQPQAVEIFKDVGLQYTRETRKLLKDKVFKNLEYQDSDLQVQEEIGRGPVATVFRALYQGQEVAFKRYPMLDGVERAVESQAFMLSTMLDTPHPNVMRLHGVLKQPAYKGLVLDFFPNGSLQQLFHNLAEGSPQPSLFQRANWALHVARAMVYLHGHKLGCIVHGALKPSNIFISNDKRAVVDLGLISGLAQGWTATMTTMPANMTAAAAGRAGMAAALAHNLDDHASVWYQAPEVQPLLDAGQKRQAASDVYAFGILLFELMTLQPVWKGFAKDVSEYEKKIRQGVRPPIPRHLPDQMQFIISQCWDHNPDLRCDFVTIVDLLELACEALAT